MPSESLWRDDDISAGYVCTLVQSNAEIEEEVQIMDWISPEIANFGDKSGGKKEGMSPRSERMNRESLEADGESQSSRFDGTNLNRRESGYTENRWGSGPSTLGMDNMNLENWQTDSSPAILAESDGSKYAYPYQSKEDRLRSKPVLRNSLFSNRSADWRVLSTRIR
ncbi:hypothetical protein L2E82_40514 [Cichorium intybus]|uniref:Uncharacterized protein n=1 Tax=Cichorium intybus TaxID=13427 RepID=A0ACB9AM63_CICIN|nr:hypothetical protein L2E82_40514 [Cichorium intybus]